ncbi:MAG: hypothetical protein FWF94_05060 [Oscillospiraceae bacterium]|nr:hypothetical protein [Oscillospiraceae bacterium]
MNRKLARRVAREHGVSVKEVREECQAAIAHAYRKPNFYARQVYSKGATPTTSEFIAHAVGEVKSKCPNI